MSKANMTASSDDKPSNFGLYRAVICANCISFSMGTAIAWSSPMIPKLLVDGDENPIGKKITTLQMAYIFSLLSVGALTSTLFSIKIIDHLGRKALMYAAIIFYFLAVINMLIAKTIQSIYMLRLLEGLGAGCTMTVIPIYIGEIALKENRGSCGTTIMLFMSLGQLFDYIIGPYVTFKVFYYHILVPPIIAIVGQIFVPESPTFLVMKGRTEDAMKSLLVLRGTNQDIVKREISEIQGEISRTAHITKLTCVNIWFHPIERKAFIIIILLGVFQTGSGAVIMVVNPQTLFESADFAIDGPRSTIIMGICQAITSFTVQFFVDHMKRRTLLQLSIGGILISHLTLGTFFLINDYGNPDHIRWSPLSAGVLFQISYRAGIGPLVFAMLGEMFSPGSKGIAGSAVTVTIWASGVIILFVYPLVNREGEYYVFFGLVFINMLAFLFVHFVVVETLGLSLEEIQAQL